jgi:hypothetical protein
VIAVAGLNILFWMLLWGALLRTFELSFHDSPSVLGSSARALAVIY